MLQNPTVWKTLVALAMICVASVVPDHRAIAGLVDVEDVGASLGTEDFYNGSDAAGGFTSGGVGFNNQFLVAFGSWSGWAYSNTTDSTSPGFANQYSAFAGEGAGGSATYGVAFDALAAGFGGFRPETVLPAGTKPVSLMVTNTTYPGLSMRDGDSFAKKFGGPTGNDPDWFLLTIHGEDAFGQALGSVDFYLADFRFVNNADDFIVDQWTAVDLSSLSDARTLKFELTSSDVDPVFGMNTPAFFAMDDFLFAPAVTGDISTDGVVDIGDFTQWADAFGQTGLGINADISADGVVDIGDFTSWADHFGATSTPGGQISAVPEPSALLLLALGMCGLLTYAQWNRRR